MAGFIYFPLKPSEEHLAVLWKSGFEKAELIEKQLRKEIFSDILI